MNEFVARKGLLVTSGSVGIGTTSPTAKLDVVGAATFSSSVTAGGINAFLTGGLSSTSYALNASISSNASAASVAPVVRLSNNGGGFVTKLMFSDNNRGDAYITHVAGSALAPSTRWLGFGVDAVDQMIINASGNVGIGTASPSYKLQISGTSTSLFKISNLLVNRGIMFGVDGSSEPSIQAVVDNSDVARQLSINPLGGNVGIGTSSPTTKLSIGGVGSAISFDTTGAVGTSIIQTVLDYELSIKNNRGTSSEIRVGNEVLTFFTNSSERMRITSTGDTFIGTTSSIYTTTGRRVLEIAGGTTGAIVSLKTNTSTTMAYYFADTSDVYLSKVAATGGRLYLVNVSGGLYLTENATTWTSSSDERLKNITGIIDSAVDKLMTLRAVNFSWKSDNTSKENLGLIAQDVEKVFPQIIDKNKLAGTPNNPQKDETEYLGVRYQELIPILVKAVQELKQEIETLKNK